MEKRDISSLLRELEDQKYALDQAAIVAATDNEGRSTYVNDRFCEISGYARHELLGQNHRLINSGYHPPEFFHGMWKTISGGGTWRGDIRNRSKTGRLYWVNTTIVPFLDSDKQPYQYLSIRQEITALKDAEQIILNQQSQLVASSKLSALGELSAALTHEVNNPLSVILGRAEMLMNMLSQPSPNMESVREMISSIQQTGQRIEKIMRTVRAMAHGGEAEPLQKVSVQSLINSALDIIGSKLRHQHIQLKLDLSDKEQNIECRPTEIFQILVNLIGNAIHAVSGKTDSWIQIQSKENAQGVDISVTDSGNGIPLEVRNKLFKPFFTTKEAGVGTGLGLTISKTLANRNGGDLVLDTSSANTRFVLSLPFNQNQNLKK